MRFAMHHPGEPPEILPSCGVVSLVSRKERGRGWLVGEGRGGEGREALEITGCEKEMSLAILRDVFSIFCESPWHTEEIGVC